MNRRQWSYALLSLIVSFMVAGAAGAEDAKPVAGVFRADLPGQRADVADALSASLGAAGYTVEPLDVAALCDPARLDPAHFNLIAFPNSEQLPLASYASVDAYLKSGGDIIAFNAPMWKRSLERVGDSGRQEWQDYATYREEYARKGAGRLPEHVLFDFNENTLSGWKRGTNKEQPEAVYTTIADGPAQGQRAFHAVIPDLSGWETLGPASVQNAFPDGHTLTVFSAKGAPETTELSVEWAENDGSRWIAVIPLTTEWHLYVLEPKDFKYWKSEPSREKDVFHPERATRLAIGLAYTHTHTRGPRQEYWVGPLGTAKPSEAFRAIAQPPDTPRLDTLAPAYKLFDAHDVASLAIRADQALVSGGADILAAPKDIRSSHPRPRGAGFEKGLLWRWIPIVEAHTRDGEWRGAPVALMAHAAGPYKGGVWASFGVCDLDWYLSASARAIVEQLGRRMRQGAFILEGGSNYYTYFDDQSMKLGVRAANLGRSATVSVVARVRVTDRAANKEVFSKDWPVTLSRGQETSVSVDWRPSVWPKDGFAVETSLEVDGAIIDRTSHEAYVWRPKDAKQFVSVKDGEFTLNGAPWRAHGVNYMPSSGIGIEDGEYFEYWVGARPYDPEVIDRDLRHIKSLGLNAVSIFIHYPSLASQNLLDILRRLDALGIKANVALRPGSPMKFPWETVRDLIQRYRLAENDTVFAYDLDWEPVFGAPSERAVYDSEWRDWVVNRYGSVENAESDWGFKAPRSADGLMLSPDGTQMSEDGAWRKMSAAYRRFLDTLLYERYSHARRMVRSIDPNHLVSFRMAEAGNPTCNSAGFLPYDFPYLASAVDFLAPEAYGRLGGWDRVKPGVFEYEYARWAAPGKPMIWAEAGVSAWAPRAMESSSGLLADQGEQYRQFYRMLLQSGANGVFFWWYPGGYRVGEDSDYGIINPDGSDRAATAVIRENASKFLAKPSAPPVNVALEMDRDANAQGLFAAYNGLKDAFWKAVEEGKTPGLKTAGTGSTSADCPLVAVGNTPHTDHNPPKYLDAAVDCLEAQLDGQWRALDLKRLLLVGARGPVRFRVTLTNAGEATWLAPSLHPGVGAVYLTVSGNEDTRVPLPHDVRHGETITLENVSLSHVSQFSTSGTAAVFSLMSEGRTPFGPRLAVKIEP